jgi:hypothetical protein
MQPDRGFTADTGRRNGSAGLAAAPMNPREAVELRMGVQPIEELLDQRRTLVAKVADLRAQYGSFGTWDAQRKVLLSGVKAKLRAQFVAAKTSVTEAKLDEEAHASGEYASFITTATRQRAEWITLENAVQDINDLIQRDQAIARHVSAEARLTP